MTKAERLERLADRLFDMGYDDVAHQVADVATEARWAEEAYWEDYDEETEM